jgi:hypothetical protein
MIVPIKDRNIQNLPRLGNEPKEKGLEKALMENH